MKVSGKGEIFHQTPDLADFYRMYAEYSDRYGKVRWAEVNGCYIVCDEECIQQMKKIYK